MSIELRQAAEQVLEAFETFGEADDFASLFALTQKMNALRTALTPQTATSGPVKAERDQLRCAQADAVMPLIGPLLDAWENADREVISQEPELSRQLKAINNAMEGAQPATTEPVADGLPLIVAGAIFDFAGFLTTRAEVIEVGSTANAGPVADLVKEWAELRGLNLADAAVLSWQLHITRASLPATTEPLTGCNCRWQGGTQVEWCELHLAHKDAIHEWAQRAKAAEATPEPVMDVRCEGCGYMTHHREHMGCVRAAKQYTHPAPSVPDDVALTIHELRHLADKFSEGWHEGIKIDAMDVMLLSDAARKLEIMQAAMLAAASANEPKGEDT